MQKMMVLLNLPWEPKFYSVSDLCQHAPDLQMEIEEMIQSITFATDRTSITYREMETFIKDHIFAATRPKPMTTEEFYLATLGWKKLTHCNVYCWVMPQTGIVTSLKQAVLYEITKAEENKDAIDVEYYIVTSH